MLDRYRSRNEARLSRVSIGRLTLARFWAPIEARPRSTQGFTIIEVLVVMVMIGILSAIAGPSWLTFVGGQRLKAVSNRALLAAREAQVKSKQQHRSWQVSFQEADGALQYWVHPVKATGSPLWQAMSDGKSNEITIDADTSTLSTDCGPGDYCVKFEDRGILDQAWEEKQANVSDDVVGRITFKRRSDQFDDPNRQCLVLTSLLGSLQLNRNEDCSS